MASSKSLDWDKLGELIEAFDKRHVAIIRTRRKSDGASVAVICSVTTNKKGQPTAKPLAEALFDLTDYETISSSMIEGAIGRDKGKWTLEGYDAFEGSIYPLEGSYDTESDAEAAAKKRLDELERSQPSESSSGQGFGGIQDQVFIISPVGVKRRYFHFGEKQ